jgi:DNA-binding response OmpR family regulator
VEELMAVRSVLQVVDPARQFDRVPLRRPRLTASEVLILNEIINAAPRPITRTQLVKVLQRYSTRSYRIYETAITQHIVNLRAKLGEEAFNPNLIVSVYIERVGGGTELAYLYKGDE